MVAGDKLTMLELVVQGHHILGLASLAHPNGQADAAVLVDHVQDLESAAIGCDVELDVQLCRKQIKLMPLGAAEEDLDPLVVTERENVPVVALPVEGVSEGGVDANQKALWVALRALAYCRALKPPGTLRRARMSSRCAPGH